MFPFQWVVFIDVREGASGASAAAPGVGLEIVSVLKLIEKDENQKIKGKEEKMSIFCIVFTFEKQN